MNLADRKIQILNRTYASTVQRLTEDIIEMKLKTEQAIRELEAIEMMTSKYQEYLRGSNRGGDWTLESFMEHLRATAEKSRQILE